MRSIRRVFLALALCAACGPAAASEGVRDLAWEDLVPKEAAYPPDPLQGLSPEQQADLGFVLRARSVAARAALPEDSPIVEAMEERTERLRKAGIDIEGLIERIRAAEAEMERADEMVVTALDGARVRVPGYVVPLEFQGRKVTEFLLVPFVGACVHVPPPPANQIVHVRLEEGFEDAGLFAPVYVTGRMSAKGTVSKSLYLTDGTVNVSFGYTLAGERVQVKVVE